MGAQSASPILQRLHDLGDRNDRGVAGEDGFGWRRLLDLDKEVALEIEILQRRLDDKVGVAYGIGQSTAGPHPFGCSGVFAEVGQILPDPCLNGIEAGLDRVIDGNGVTIDGEDLGDAMPHQPRADDSNARFLGHGSAGRVAAVDIHNLPGAEVRCGR